MERVKRKVVLLGDAAVGKTSLIRKFVMDSFDDKYITTIGTKIMKKEVPLHDAGFEVTLMIWDILGQKDYRRLQAASFVGAQGAIIVLDRTRKDTLDSINEYWMPSLAKFSPSIPLIIAGNKSDLVDELVVSPEMIGGLSDSVRGTSFATSAKTGQGVEEMFVKMAEMSIWKQPMPVLDTDKNVIETYTHACDAIIEDFCIGQGDVDTAMPYIRQQAKRADLDINDPSREELLDFIEYLFEIDKSFLDGSKANVLKKKRQGYVNTVKEGQDEQEG